MMRSSLGIAFVLSLVAVGCQSKDKTSSTGTTAGSTTAPVASAAPMATTTTVVKTPEPASAAAAFPATALPSKDLADYTIGLPTGGKLDKSGNDKASLETPDYKLMLKKASTKDDMTGMKDMVTKMPGFKAITIEKADGMVVETTEKGAKQFLITRYVKVGDVNLSCESALTKPPKDEAKAREAFDVCGTLKKK